MTIWCSRMYFPGKLTAMDPKLPMYLVCLAVVYCQVQRAMPDEIPHLLSQAVYPSFAKVEKMSAGKQLASAR